MVVCRKTGKKQDKAILSGETVLAEHTDGLWNTGRTRNSPQSYSPLISDNVPQGNVFKGCWKNWMSTFGRVNSDPCFHFAQRSLSVISLRLESPLEGNTGYGPEQGLWETTPAGQKMTSRSRQMDYVKLKKKKTLPIAKETHWQDRPNETKPLSTTYHLMSEINT